MFSKAILSVADTNQKEIEASVNKEREKGEKTSTKLEKHPKKETINRPRKEEEETNTISISRASLLIISLADIRHCR